MKEREKDTFAGYDTYDTNTFKCAVVGGQLWPVSVMEGSLVYEDNIGLDRTTTDRERYSCWFKKKQNGGVWWIRYCSRWHDINQIVQVLLKPNRIFLCTVPYYKTYLLRWFQWGSQRRWAAGSRFWLSRPSRTFCLQCWISRCTRGAHPRPCTINHNPSRTVGN